MTTTTTKQQTMTRSQIIAAAKDLVLHKGPANVLEFGGEYVDEFKWLDGPRYANRDAILREAQKQAERVYTFLGYDAPR